MKRFVKSSICHICGKRFNHIVDNAKTCGPTCRSRLFAKRHKKEPLITECHLCGTKFNTVSLQKRYCSKICRLENRFIRESNNINCKLKKNLRSRINEAINHRTKRPTILILLGCSVDQLKAHLESKFQEGMSWENYGKWHIDHIKPLCSFDLTNHEELKVACHYSNLQPLWAEHNLKKGSKIDYEIIEKEEVLDGSK